MKKVLLSLAIIGVVAGLVAGGTIAYFTDDAEVAGNTFATGSADLHIREADGTWHANDISGVDFNNIYPGWTAEETIQLRNDSSADIGMDIVPRVERKGSDNDNLRNMITLQFFNEEGEAKGNALTLSEWNSGEWILDHIANGEASQEWTLEFKLPATGENQDNLQNSDVIEFDLIFDGIQAETPITEVTNETQGETYENLEAAIDAADSGDTILLPGGDYDGFKLNKGLTLKGVDDDVVINSKSDVSAGARPSGIYVNTDDKVNVENIKFENGGIDVEDYTQGIVTESGRNPEINISNSEFTDLYIGVYFNPSVKGVIDNNVFDGISGSSYTAVGTHDAAGVEITGNDISNSDIGIEIVGGGVTYSGNTFDNVDTDIEE